MLKVIAYCRVSKRDQALRRNGIEGQQTEIRRFADANEVEVLQVIEEQASRTLGLDKRPQLAHAIAECKRLKCGLVVSRLDRFSGNVSFIAQAMEQFDRDRIPFYIASNGLDTNTFRLHIEAAVAQDEIARISYRIKTALVEVKRKGKRLGNTAQAGTYHADGRPKATLLDAQRAGGKANVDKAMAYAHSMRPIIEPMRQQGMTYKAIAERLNQYATPTDKGGRWSIVSVRNLTLRWD